MKYSVFEDIISPERMQRYLVACNNNTRKAMTLYRYNIKLSQELLAFIGYFEVALRNKINKRLITQFGNDWLRDAILPDGIFYSDHRVQKTKSIIQKVYQGLCRSNSYSHNKLLSEMEFGIWKYMFSNVQYALTGQTLLSIFKNKPTSSPSKQYTNTYIFQELDYINNLRNRIAHHEPICFGNGRNHNSIDTSYAINRYTRILILLNWLDINGEALLYGFGDINKVIRKIENLTSLGSEDVSISSCLKKRIDEAKKAYKNGECISCKTTKDLTDYLDSL